MCSVNAKVTNSHAFYTQKFMVLGRVVEMFGKFCIILLGRRVPKNRPPRHTMMYKKLVIIPTYLESENVARMVEAVLTLSEPFDLLIIDDGSPDGTADIVRNLQSDWPERLFLIERPGKLGLGTAYITGFRWALEHNYDYIFEMDCDFSHNPNDLPVLYNHALSGSDVVVGSRYVQGVNVVHWPMRRLLISFCASHYVRTVTGMPVRDATAGFVCYSADVLRKIDLDNIRMKGYGFQIEMKYTAWQLGFNIGEVPIIFVDRTQGVSKMSSSIFGEAFWGVIALRLRNIKPAAPTK